MANSGKVGFLTRMQRAASILIDGGPDVWMSPGDPIAPIAPAQDVEGRQFDFGVGQNMMMTPKAEGTALRAVTMTELRWLAESTEVLRTIIETRKDKICGMEWSFRLIDEKPEVSRKDARVQWVKKFFRKPDGVNGFDSWLRPIQEDLVVIDAPSLHVKRDSSGAILAFEQIDGATVKPLLNKLGRIPEAPNAAYMHVLKGFPAIYYSTDDLIYAPRNRRVFTSYGFSPVEQIMVYCNMAIRRQMQQLGYFTEGNMPEGMIPVQGTAEQVVKFQKVWDSGEVGGQKIGRIKFVPADSATKFQAFKDPILADAFDEWMARVCCYVMSEDPTPFLKQVNRATAEQADKSAMTSGLNVHVRHVKAMLDSMIQDYLGFPEIEAFVVPTKTSDPKATTDRVKILVELGVMSKDEARAEEGLEGPAPEPVAPPVAAPPEAPKVEPVARLSRAEAPAPNIDASRINAEATKPAVEDAAFEWLRNAAQIGSDAILDKMTTAQRAEGDWIEAIDFDQSAFLAAVMPPLEAVFQTSANIALGTVGADIKIGFKREASEWARERGSQLIGKSVDPLTGEVRDALRPGYRIDDLCRDAVRKTFDVATRENWTNEKITQSLIDDHAFSRSRAMTIAQTEIVNADESGKSQGWAATGFEMEKRSILASNENHGPDDIANAGQGWIPLAKAFQSGHMHPGYHVGCLCSTIARKKVTA